MSELLTVDELLGIAIQIEANGAAFYRRAAALRDDADAASSYLLRLATMEDGHKQRFQAMRAALLAEERAVGPDLHQEGWLYVSSIANGYGVEGSPSAAERLTGKESLESILTMAVNLEKQSILFYLGLRDILGSKSARSRVDRIIADEKAHVVTLMSELRAVRGS